MCRHERGALAGVCAEACELAPCLLALADEEGLARLRAVALDFIVHHHERVAAASSYASLNKRQMDLIAAEACQLLARMRSVLASVGAPSTDKERLRGWP